MPNDEAVRVVTYPEDCESLEEFVDVSLAAIRLDVPTVVVAESFSGLVLAKLLVRHVPSVVGAVFCAAFATSPRPLALRLLSRLPLKALLRVPPPNVALRAFCLGKDATVELVSSLKQVLTQLPPAVVARRLQLISKGNTVRDLSRIEVPCCYVT